MELVFEDAGLFKRAVDAIAVLIDEAEFIVDQKGFALKATGPSQISMVDFFLDKNAFKEFKVPSLVKLGLDLNYLSQIMARAKSKDALELALEKDNSRLHIVFKGEGTRRFSIPLIDVSAAELPSPKIDFDAEIIVAAGSLQDSLKDASLISSHVSLGTDGAAFYVKAHSSKGTLNNELSKKDKSVKEIKAKKDAAAMFPLDYLQNMLKSADSATSVSVCLKSSAPVKIAYPIGASTITYFLAPRIESD